MVEQLEPDWRSELLGVITSPTIAYLLLLIGVYGLILEGYNPGAVLPGVVTDWLASGPGRRRSAARRSPGAVTTVPSRRGGGRRVDGHLYRLSQTQSGLPQSE